MMHNLLSIIADLLGLIIMIQANVLQPVPGSEDAQIYPYIRKIDLMSSNSYLLDAEEQIALIDPGALDDQTDTILEIISDLLEEKTKPIVIYLTHVHLDHCFQLKRLQDFRMLGDVRIASQEYGAKALQNQDSKATLADLLGKKLGPVPVDIKLLSRTDIAEARGCDPPTNVRNLENKLRPDCTVDGPAIDCQIISISRDDLLEIYHTPGHSPDSVCIRLGRLLFVGDLFFAPNPGMAGAYGWSQTDLLNSIRKVLWILKHKDILCCCSGHGRIVDASLACSSLESMYRDVLSLSGLEKITEWWVRSIALYAEDQIRELERLFTIIVARLDYISHVLRELEENSEADKLQSLLDAQQIEQHFLDFHRFIEELRLGRKLDWELVHKAGQIVVKLDSAIEDRVLETVLDQKLQKRVQRMLNDYTITYRGFQPTYYVSDTDINAILRELSISIEHKPYKEDAILDADCIEDYLEALRIRIGHIDILSTISLEIIEVPGLPLVRMDKERFNEAAADLLERLTCAGAKKIRFNPSYCDGLVQVRISVKGDQYHCPLDKRTMRFFERAFALCGGFIQTFTTKEESGVEIEFLPCKMI
ncbi:Hydroxyacylglutathione hydrolase [uncultured archaeon]|nr:Hydroxyacylglutathione hydrolase [uncultured archaeon]